MKVIRFGDSNAYGHNASSWFEGRYDADSRWVDILAAETRWIVCNMGENGREIPTTALTFPDVPDLLIVMLGANDLLQRRSPKNAAGKLERFLSGTSLARDKILLIAPPPMALGERVPSQQLINASNTLAQRCQASTKRLKIRFADAGKRNISLAYDGVHFTE